MKIVLVEDNADLCDAWSELLSLLGHDVKRFQCGAEALDDVQRASCDVIISDFYLPDMTGIELIERMRAGNAQLPALVLTGSREPSVLDAANALDRCRLLLKPVSVEDLESHLLSIDAARSAQ